MATRKRVDLLLPPDLIDRIATQAATLGQTRTKFIERAVEAALSDDTQAASSAERPSGQHAHGEPASATGAVTARGASRPAASPRASDWQEVEMERRRKARGR